MNAGATMADYTMHLRVMKGVACCPVGNGVIFAEERFARIFAERHNKDLVELKDVVPSAWLARNRPGSTDNDDALIEVIKKAIQEQNLGEC
jgi:hypothetical protein